MSENKDSKSWLSMLDKKDTTLELHDGWGQFYMSNLPECQSSKEDKEYASIAIYFDSDTHNLTFMKKLQLQVDQAILWLEENQAKRRPTTCDVKGGLAQRATETEAESRTPIHQQTNH